MDFNKIKKLNEKCPQFIKVACAPFIRGRLIKNKVFINTYKGIDKFNSLSEEEKDLQQFKKLKDDLIYCYNNVQYYKELFDKINFDPYKITKIQDIKTIPYLTKEIVIENEGKLLSKENINYYLAHTGGSSGKPLAIYLDKESIYKERAFVYNYWAKFGYDVKKSKMLTFRGLEFEGKTYKFNPIYNEIVMSPFKLNENTIDEYVKVIRRFKPNFICGYPSALMNFCRLLEKSKESLTFKGIFFISENCSVEEKSYIEGVLKGKSTSFYGHSERAVFAEKYDDTYVFNKLYGYTELIPLEEENKYRIVCTGFLNKKMPLVRYLTDDIAVIHDGNMDIIGHWDKEMLIGKNEEKISIASINFHTDEFKKIKQYQFEQLEKGKVILKIVKEENISKDDISLMNKALEKKLKNILDVEIKIVDSIALSNRGKVKKIIQHLKT